MTAAPKGNLGFMPKKPIQPDTLLQFQFVGDARMSPDGSCVLFAKKHINEKNKYITNLYSVSLSGEVKQWTAGEGGNAAGRWSPTGDRIAFVSGREKPSQQIHLLSASGGEAQKLTSLPEGSIGAFSWSPDGSMIAVSFRETHPNRTEKAKKEREEKGLSDPPWELEDIWYRLDGDGYFGPQRFALYVVDVATGEHRLLYDKDPTGFFSFDWFPDSNSLAVCHTANKRPFAEPDNDHLYLVDLKGKVKKLAGLPKGPKGGVKVSPDGKWIAYAGRVSEDDPWGVKNDRLWVVPAEGGDPRCLTENDDYCLTAATLGDSKEASFEAALVWAPDSNALYVQIGANGEQQVAMVSREKGGVEFLTQGKHNIALGTVSKDGSKVSCTWGDATTLHEVAVLDLDRTQGKPQVLTDFNGKLLSGLKIAEPKDFWLDTPDGSRVHVWVIEPTETGSKKTHPAVLEIHGGPHAQYGWAFFHEFQVLAAEGYVVVYSNPRGSKGYGEAFCEAIKGDWGNKDWIDIQTVLHWMEHQPYIDAGSMGVMGGSYGGYMTNWVVGQTPKLKAAITDRCVSNMVSMAGNSDFPFNKDAYFKGTAWGDLKDIEELWKQSPIAYFKSVKTPMLIIHSEGDLRCNVEQSEQVFTALQQEGVPSRFVRYPSNTSHGMSRNGPPDLRLHRLNEILGWWRRWLK